jgi:hypothetical protein
MSRVLGIDAGGLGNPSWLAFLDADHRVTLTQHVFTLDAPQGLPRASEKRRDCNATANTPTGLLPGSRAEMDAGESADGKKFVYLGPVQTAVAVFWANRRWLLGLVQQPRLVETYPNVVFRSLTGRHPPPKTKRPCDYCVAVAALMSRLGLSCPGVEIPSVDQCDAILCAIAAKAFIEDEAEALGLPPLVDEAEHVLREGFIVTLDSRIKR